MNAKQMGNIGSLLRDSTNSEHKPDIISERGF